MGQIKPQKKVLTLWRIVFSLGMAVPAFVSALIYSFGSVVWICVTAVWLLLFLGGYLFYLPLRYSKLSYSLTKDKIILFSGVIYTRQRAIPLRNIQFTSLKQNFLERIFGLCTLVVTAAGGHLVISGLYDDDAKKLGEILGA